MQIKCMLGKRLTFDYGFHHPQSPRQCIIYKSNWYPVICEVDRKCFYALDVSKVNPCRFKKIIHNIIQEKNLGMKPLYN